MTTLIRSIIALALALSCTAVSAQDEPKVLRIHQTEQSVDELPLEVVDSMTVPDAMTVFLSSGNRLWYPLEAVDSITFATKTTETYHEAVDLGLSVCWAACNVGAERPEDFGGRYAWGEITIKSNYEEKNYRFYKNEGYEQIGVNICGTAYDVARRKWGGTWRMPTRSEISELTTRCTWTPETLNGTPGYRVTAANGNSIFLPAAGFQNGREPSEVGSGGFYWSGNLDRSMPSAAYNLNFRGYDADWSACRAYGFSVRPVR